jgi:hypothetical protein
MSGNIPPRISLFCSLNTVQNKTLYRCIVIMLDERFFN